jgi:hypothetical protein
MSAKKNAKEKDIQMAQSAFQGSIVDLGRLAFERTQVIQSLG